MTGKVAIITERFNISLGGAERSILELSSALAEHGLKVEILAAKGKSTAGNIHTLCSNHGWSGRTGYFAFAKALKKHLLENHYDIIHSTLPFNFADIYQPRGGSYAESIIRNTASYQNGFLRTYKKATSVFNLRRTILLKAERKLCEDAGGPVVAALSGYVAEQFKRHYGIADARIVMTPNGVNINEPVSTEEKYKRQILNKLNIKRTDKPVFFLFAANNFRLKGLAGLIKAMQKAVSGFNSADRIRLLIAGRDKPGKYRRLAGKLGIEGKIIFLGPVRHIQNILSVADVAVLPTFYDPASRFILEAIAAAKPVITTRFNGAIDAFSDKRHGRIIDSPLDTAALSEAIRHFSDPENIRKASNAIEADNLKAKISIDCTVSRIINVYESIIKGRLKK